MPGSGTPRSRKARRFFATTPRSDVTARTTLQCRPPLGAVLRHPGPRQRRRGFDPGKAARLARISDRRLEERPLAPAQPRATPATLDGEPHDEPRRPRRGFAPGSLWPAGVPGSATGHTGALRRPSVLHDGVWRYGDIASRSGVVQWSGLRFGTARITTRLEFGLGLEGRRAQGVWRDGSVRFSGAMRRGFADAPLEPQPRMLALRLDDTRGAWPEIPGFLVYPDPDAWAGGRPLDGLVYGSAVISHPRNGSVLRDPPGASGRTNSLTTPSRATRCCRPSGTTTKPNGTATPPNGMTDPWPVPLTPRCREPATRDTARLRRQFATIKAELEALQDQLVGLEAALAAGIALPADAVRLTQLAPGRPVRVSTSPSAPADDPRQRWRYRRCSAGWRHADRPAHASRQRVCGVDAGDVPAGSGLDNGTPAGRADGRLIQTWTGRPTLGTAAAQDRRGIRQCLTGREGRHGGAAGGPGTRGHVRRLRRPGGVRLWGLPRPPTPRPTRRRLRAPRRIPPCSRPIWRRSRSRAAWSLTGSVTEGQLEAALAAKVNNTLPYKVDAIRAPNASDDATAGWTVGCSVDRRAR